MNFSITNSFKKKERLCTKKEIEQLFTEGNQIIENPFIIYYYKYVIDCKNDTPVKVLISVPKKKISKVIRRNLIKRRIKEIYRKNKKDLILKCIKNNIGINIAFVYFYNETLAYNKLESKIVLSLQNLIKLL